MTAPSLLVLMAATTDTITNTGSSAQNPVPGVRSIPGQTVTSGRSSQDASATGRRSYRPKNRAAAHPGQDAAERRPQPPDARGAQHHAGGDGQRHAGGDQPPALRRARRHVRQPADRYRHHRDPRSA